MIVGFVAKLEPFACWENIAQHSELEIDTFYGIDNFALWHCRRKTTTLVLI
jgi:hypothetical protein